MVYNGELKAIKLKEREVVMQWTNEWIEKGKAEGLQEGRQVGLLEGRCEFLLSQLSYRFGTVSVSLSDKIAGLSESRLKELGKAIFDFQDLADLDRWLTAH